MQDYQNGCIAVIGSVTQAMRAQKVLANAAIRTELVKTGGKASLRGCAYALSYPCTQDGNVKNILLRAGIRVRDVGKEGSDDLS